MAARQTALSVLIACRRQGAWSDGALKEYIVRDRLDARDAALASRLCYGVLQNRALLDFDLACVVHGGLKKLQPVVLDILRLAAYQILFLDKIPPSAAVNEAVEQGKRYANRQAAGLINAALRTLLREKDSLPQPEDLATRYSHSPELIALLTEAVGEEKIERLLAAHNEAPQLAAQINTLLASTDAVQRELEGQNIACQRHPWLPDCLLLQGSGNLERLDAFREGRLYVQDPAARLAVLCAEPRPGMRVLDCCAAPGGKSFAAAICMQNEGEILSCDIHAHKLKLIEAGAARLELSCIRTMLRDAARAEETFDGQMDVVLADVPCSGLGVIRKKPDIREKNLEQIARLPALQLAILKHAARAVKPGGVLLYSTCTILKRENEEVVAAFLRDMPSFETEALPLPEGLTGGESGCMTLLPCDHGTDGFFLCRLRRKQ